MHVRLGFFLLSFLLAPASLADPSSKLVFTDWGKDVGLSDLAGPTHVSSWLDIDLDGVAEGRHGAGRAHGHVENRSGHRSLPLRPRAQPSST